jgi:PAS domain S-box-containing protein
MRNESKDGKTERILICAPFGRDSDLIRRELQAAGLSTIECGSSEELCARLEDGAGAALIGDQAFAHPGAVTCLSEALAQQPPWSDIPVLVVTSGGRSKEKSREVLRQLQFLGRLTLLERPLRPATLISSVRSAIRARRQQYQIRDYVKNLEESRQALRESEKQFRTLANAMPNLAWMANPSGWVFWYNQRWYEYTGATPKSMEGWGWQSVQDPEILPSVMERWQQSLATGQPFHMVFPLRGADGRFRPFLTRVEPMKDSQGRVVRWFGTNTDISEQQQREQELQRANEDLEQFAYSASHDLQEPLRNVAVYSQLLKKRYGGALDREANEFLRYIGEGAKRMTELVSDLLAYTRAGSSADGPVEPTDSQAVLEQVLENLAQAIAESHGQVTHDRLPIVLVRPGHLQQLFQNLISNALKYRKEKEAPRVHVKAARQGSIWRFSIADNGIGIAPEYHDKVFGVFKRLHSNNEKYAGTGIGLAICQKIVERYGGRIWIESESGAGSVFHFTLPAASAEHLTEPVSARGSVP